MEIVRSLNLVLRFILELCMLGAFGYWGFHTGQSSFGKVALSIGAPLLAAVVWGLFLAPKASRRLRDPWSLILELVIFGLAVAALYSTGQPDLALAFGIIYGISRILMSVL